MEKKKSLRQIKYILALAALAMGGVVYANGLGGQRLEKVVGDLIVDVGTDQIGIPLAGKPIEFDFNLLRADTRDPVTTTSVGVDIGSDGKTLVNCDLITDPQVTFLFYTFPQPGNYTLKVTFFDKDRSLASASFPLAISGERGRPKGSYVGLLLVGFLLGLGGGYRAARRQKGR